MRGEYTLKQLITERRMGSPPLARGIPTYNQTKRVKRGITPACAGNTDADASTYNQRRDHPRLRGEYFMVASSNSNFIGSPPLARGILLKRVRYLIIDMDHPRLRGEYLTT